MEEIIPRAYKKNKKKYHRVYDCCEKDSSLSCFDFSKNEFEISRKKNASINLAQERMESPPESLFRIARGPARPAVVKF